MKPFDLEKALAGEPVLLRNGNKAFVLASIPDIEEVRFPLLGYACNKNGNYSSTEQWADNGMFTIYDEEHSFDIVAMWQESRPRVQLDLPCPLKEPQEGMWFITESGEAVKSNYRYDYTDALNLEGFASGLYFATKEDAQEWLDAMRNARR